MRSIYDPPKKNLNLIGTYLKTQKRIDNEKKIPKLEAEVAELKETKDTLETANGELRAENDKFREAREAYSNYIFKPGTEAVLEEDTKRQKSAEKVKSDIDKIEQKMLSFDNNPEFDSNPEKGVVELTDGVLSGDTKYQGTYDNGEMNVSRSLHAFGRFHLLDGATVTKNKFGFDRIYKNHVGMTAGWESYDDIRGGLVNHSSGGFQYIPV